MYCTRCGKELIEGEVCTCAENTVEQKTETATLKSGLSISTLIGYGIGLLSFFFTLVLPWYSTGNSYFSIEYGPYAGPSVLGQSASFSDIDAPLLLIVQIFSIINIIVFIASAITKFVDVKKFVPQLEKIDIKKHTTLAYYGILAVSLVFGFIGALALESTSPAIGWYFALVFAAAGIVNFFKPEILKNLLKEN